MEQDVTEMVLNGVTYVKKGSENAPATKLEGMDYCVIRTYSAGVFAGYVESESEDGKQVILRDSRRLWYWDGAASLSQMAEEGVSKPSNCKFAMVVGKMQVNECIEKLYCSEKARKNIQEVSVWRQ
jgi:hypothetical protein